LSNGQKLSDEFETIVINEATISQNLIEKYKQAVVKYDNLPLKEKNKLSVKAKKNLKEGSENIKKYCIDGKSLYYSFNNGTLTLFGSGSVPDVYPKFIIKDGKKQVIGKGYFHKKHLNDAKKLIVQKGVSYIGNGAFSYFPALTDVEINGDKDHKVTLATSVFFRCDKLKNVKLFGVKSVGLACFGRCKKLETVKLGTEMETIGKSAFTECVKLGSIEFPGTVKNIGYAAFSYCTKLKTLTFNGKVKKCGNFAFYASGKKKKKTAYYRKAKPSGKLKKQLTSAGYKLKKK
jgi:hypothetical protein